MSEQVRMVDRMDSISDDFGPPATSTDAVQTHRRNRAERLIRDRLDTRDDIYVHRSSWHPGGAGVEPCVAVIARNDDARDAARAVLEDLAGLPEEHWQQAWTQLSLGDWMIWVYPERVSILTA